MRSFIPAGLIKKRVAAVVPALGALALLATFSGCTLDGKSRASAPVPATPRGSSVPPTAYPMPPIMTAQEAAAANYGWTLLDGRRVGLADYRGEVVVLDFYGTWCAPCREEIPHLVALQKRYDAQGLNIIGLNVGDAEDKQKVPGFVAELGIDYALGDPDRGLSDLFLSDNNSIPQTYVFDRGGRLVKRFIGYDDSMPAQLESVIQSALNAQ